MRGLKILLIAVTVFGAAWAFQRPFRQYPGQEYTNFEVPSDANEKTEFVMGRLMFRASPYGMFGQLDRYYDWREGRTGWTNDYPRADRHFVQAVRRLTRVHVRSAEQPVNLDDGDDVFDWPWIFAVQSSPMDLTAQQAGKLREYLLRGGFLMCADTWGDDQWDLFASAMKRVFPERDFVEIPDRDPVFHVIYDLKDRYGIPGEWSLRSGVPYLNGGRVGHWRGIYDDKNRLMVVADFNSDTSDSWEWADEPRYPEKYSAQGIRIGVNYIIYAMSH
ncbi:MAG TPA: DUF4159 domain-containing protein [Bryobacteraceae bacterium]|jgi:hypothetical protein|nr:DUF4159 domain-containing protein [Bryobacteraceae bacterium]